MLGDSSMFSMSTSDTFEISETTTTQHTNVTWFIGFQLKYEFKYTILNAKADTGFLMNHISTTTFTTVLKLHVRTYGEINTKAL